MYKLRVEVLNRKNTAKTDDLNCTHQHELDKNIELTNLSS